MSLKGGTVPQAICLFTNIRHGGGRKQLYDRIARSIHDYDENDEEYSVDCLFPSTYWLQVNMTKKKRSNPPPRSSCSGICTMEMGFLFKSPLSTIQVMIEPDGRH